MQSRKFVQVIGTLVAIVMLLPTALLAQKSPPPALPTPPGTVQLSDNLFMDDKEVANLHWLEYLHQIKRDSTAAFYRSQLPDSTVRTLVVSTPNTNSAKSTAQHYLLSPAHRYYPLVDISYEQAIAYCKWRSAVVNRDFFQSEGFLRKHPALRGFSVLVEYRLPTEEEWQQAASTELRNSDANSAAPFYTKFKRQSPVFLTSDALANCRTTLSLPKAEKVYQLPYNLQENYYLGKSGKAFFCQDNKADLELDDTHAHPDSGSNFYNLIGNVAEMTTVKGVAKGGSFNTSVQGLTLASRQLYEGSQNWVGFRCVATVRLVPKVRQY